MNIADVHSEGVSSPCVSVEAVGLHLIRLPLKEAFETSFGSINTRLIFLVSVEAGGVRGWGEVVAAEESRYSYETVATAWHVIRDYLAQALMAKPVTGLADLAARFTPFKGHNMAKAGLELAYHDLSAQLQGLSLSEPLAVPASECPWESASASSLNSQPCWTELIATSRLATSTSSSR